MIPSKYYSINISKVVQLTFHHSYQNNIISYACLAIDILFGGFEHVQVETADCYSL